MKAVFILKKGSIEITEERDVEIPHAVYHLPERKLAQVMADYGSYVYCAPTQVTTQVFNYTRQVDLDAQGRAVYVCTL